MPDGAFYFPVREDGFRTNESQLEDALQWKHSAHERLAKQLSGNLAHDTLVDLEKFGLQFCPFGPSNSKSLAKDSMVCFPWLVIEHKPGDMIKTRPKEKECYCQAANASAAALMLLQRAAVFAEAKDQNQHVPPVVAVTTVGNIVRVWMTYYNQKEERDRHVRLKLLHITRPS